MHIAEHSVPQAIINTPAWRLFQEGGLATTYVGTSSDEATEIALRHFGVRGQLCRFSTEKDDTFRIDADDGQRYVLKISNPEEPYGEIDLQLRTLDHIARADPAIPVPRVHLDRHGNPLVKIVDRAGQHRHMRLLSFVEGTPLDSVASDPAGRECVGETLARLRLAMTDFHHDAASRMLAWDVKHLLQLAPLMQGVDDPAQRVLLDAGLDRFSRIADRIANLRFQVLHNDFSQSNIVVAPGATPFVTGIIDFGDVVHTAIAIDVSTALLNQLPRTGIDLVRDDIFRHGRDLLRGYLRAADLTREELALIPHLAMGRIVARALLTIWRARMFPENKTYILRNTEQGWDQLRWFLQRTEDDVSNLFSAIHTSREPSHAHARSHS